MNHKIAVIGLGYVGLPLAVEFGKKIEVKGFDINSKRIEELKSGYDRTFEVDSDSLKAASHLKFVSDIENIKDCNTYIVTVPTPIDQHKKPDLTPLLAASRTVGKVLKKGDIVIYESTVYPGCTEDDCVPVLEKTSGLVFNQDFFCGYSPERINPGDKERTLTKIRKVTSGSTPEIAKIIDNLYASIVVVGTFSASCIRVAEAAKVIENAQRDINIAFVNELSLIFGRLGIDTTEVLEAAGTKWNFLTFKPGLVGGHCIGVDPYYLAQKATETGYHPEIILAGRRLNDGMGSHIANEIIRMMIGQDIKIKNADVLVLGFTFKENCPDVRNTRVIDIVQELSDFGTNVTIYDPWADAAETIHEYGVELSSHENTFAKCYDAVVLAVSHHQFLTIDFDAIKKSAAVLYDVKAFLPRDKVDRRL